jgi:hypothetical protein
MQQASFMQRARHMTGDRAQLRHIKSRLSDPPYEDKISMCDRSPTAEVITKRLGSDQLADGN